VKRALCLSILLACLSAWAAPLAYGQAFSPLCTVSGTLYDPYGAPAKNIPLLVMKVQKTGGTFVPSQKAVYSDATTGAISFTVPRNATAWLYCDAFVGSLYLGKSGGVAIAIPDAATATIESLGAAVSVPSQGLTVKDEGTALASLIGTFNFVGAGVAVTQSSAGVAQVTINGGSVNVDWPDITNKPSTFAPSPHASSHASAGSDPLTLPLAQISNAGTAAAKNYPASGNAAAGEVVLGSDSRLSDARTPTAHAASHKNGGADEVATATPTANAIPKAGAGGTIAAAWLPDLSATYEPANSNIQSHISSTSNPHAVTKSQVGLGNVANSLQLVAANNLSDLANAGTARSNLGVAIGSQVEAWDADLDAIGGLTPSNDDVIQRKLGAWVNRTLTQLKSDLSLSGTNTGDQDLSGYVPTSRTVNGSPLSSNITISTITGNAGTATALQTARTINGTSFDGTASITVTAAAGTLTGATLASNVLASSLTSFGTVTGGTLSTGAVIGGVTMTLGSDASGDVYYRNSSGVLTRVAAGAQNTIFTMGASSVPSWQAASGGGTTINSTDGVIPYRSNSTTFADSPFSFASSAVTLTRTGIGATSADGLILANTTAASSGNQQRSPRLVLAGQGYKTNSVAGSQDVRFALEVRPTQGSATPDGTMTWTSQVNGGSYQTMMVLGPGVRSDDIGGDLSNIRSISVAASGGSGRGLFGDGGTAWALQQYYLNLHSIGYVSWSASDATATPDTKLKRNAASVLEGNNGTDGRWAGLKVGFYGSATNSISNGLTIGTRSSGTPAAGLGSGLLFNIDSTTTADQNAGQIVALWTTATHASRTSDLAFYTVNNAAALAEAGRFTGAGNLNVIGGLLTADPTSGVGPLWKLGAKKTGSLTLDTGNYIEISVAGVTYKVALVN
jgi:hypothetical protein